MNSPSYTVLDLAQFAHWHDVIHTQALAGYDALVRGDVRFGPPQYPKADGEALYYIERVAQGAIPGPCSKARTR